jgi:uncharacterized protein YjbJ (UPF0337 family)
MADPARHDHRIRPFGFDNRRYVMNEDTLEGSGQDFLGKVKETAGDVTGDGSLKSEGIADQITGKAQKVVGSVWDVATGVGPTLDRFRQYGREKPFATAAAIGIIGIALLNTLRGRK